MQGRQRLGDEPPIVWLPLEHVHTSLGLRSYISGYKAYCKVLDLSLFGTNLEGREAFEAYILSATEENTSRVAESTRRGVSGARWPLPGPSSRSMGEVRLLLRGLPL